MNLQRHWTYRVIATLGLLGTFQLALADGSANPGAWGSAQLSHSNTSPNWSAATQQVRHNSIGANRSVGQSHAGVGTSTGPARSMGGASKSGYGAYGYGNNKGGPNGMAVGYGTNNNNPKGPNGKAVGSGYNNPMGVNGKPIMGSAHASGGGGPADQYGGQGANLNNGGMAGVSAEPNDAPKTPTGQSNTGGSANGSGWGEFVNHLDDDWGHPANGKDSQGNTWQGGKLWKGFDSSGVKYNNGHPVQGGNVPQFGGGSGSLSAGDMPDSGGGGGPNATGQTVNKGNAGGGDSGGGQTDQGNNSGSAGRSGTGQYVNAGAINGGDAPLHKPADTTPLNTGKFNNGVTDPKRSGAIGH